jgi:hypothetical protein
LGKKNSSPLVWLSDGGVFNNFGTDWRRTSETMWFSTPLADAGSEGRTIHLSRYGQVQLIVDASQPSPPKQLFLLRIPLLAFFVYVSRVMDVMYGSTLAGRRVGAEREARLRMAEAPKKWRLKEWIERTPFIQQDEELDPEGQVKGPLKIYAPCELVPFELMQQWGGFAHIHREDQPGLRIFRYSTGLQKAEPLFGDLWPNRERVPTTFRRLGRRRTLRLVVHGYLMAREALVAAFPTYEPPPIPELGWFETL